MLLQLLCEQEQPTERCGLCWLHECLGRKSISALHFFCMFPVDFFRCGWITLSPISSQGQTALRSMAGRKWRICSRCWGMSKSMSCWSTSKPTIAGSKGWKPGTVDGWKAMVQDHLAVMIATGYPQDLQKKSQKKEQFGVPSSLGWTAPYSILIHCKLRDGDGQPSACRECMPLDCWTR